ncbi:nitrite reductase small subunit NirD [Zooshikella sp. WH53]|uniref:Nitrite reductase small subunit NirD n=2 Tax=Zooshikella harenae TaxID=2827238 RepID=A0ABS5ZG29_9GAMM|nr:nitrite reductase small subunit NirD [Zooshikella harenae]
MTDCLLNKTHQTWGYLCEFNDIPPNSGICVSYQNQQIALFNVNTIKKVYAVSNYDPIGKANVISRGIIGTINEQLVVASPLFKQHFNLKTGICIENPKVCLNIYAIRVYSNAVWIKKYP